MTDALSMYSLLVRARQLQRSNRRQEAIHIIQKVLRSDTAASSDGWQSLAALHLVELLGESPETEDEALQVLEQSGFAHRPEGRVEALVIAYRRGKATLDDASALAASADSLEGHWRGRLELMIAKLLAEFGALNVARNWFGRALATGRAIYDTDLVAAASGAFAEVLYLAGEPKSALELFSVDAQLLAHGSRDRERLMVYRAHCFRQLGQTEVARGLYAEALQLSEIRSESNAFALRGLVWCSVVENDSLGAHRWANELAGVRDVHSRALAEIGLAALEGASGRREQGLEYARCLLEGANYHREAAWCGGESYRGVSVPTLLESPLVEPTLDICDLAHFEQPLRELVDVHDQSLEAFTKGDALGWMGAFF